MHCTSRSLLAGAFRLAVQPHPSTLPPPFLLPAFTTIQRATFSSSPSPQARKDGNPNRGISPLRRKVTTRFAKRVEKDIANIPQPVLDPRLRSAVEVDEDHGLWEFFGQEKNSLATPVEISAHGRGWTVAELRRKDWDDLWRLWWVCLKDRNRLATFEAEKERIGNLYGEEESKKRRKELNVTLGGIKHVLTERWYAWENARYAAMEDPEVNLYADPDKGEQALIRPQEEKKVESIQDTLPPPPANEKLGSEVRA